MSIRGGRQLLGVFAVALVLGLMAGAGVLPVAKVSAQALGNGTIAVQKRVVDPQGNVINQDMSGFMFTVTPLAGGGTVSLGPTNAGGQASVIVAAGNYQIAEQPRAGYTFVSTEFAPGGGGNIGSFNVAANQTVSLIVTNRVAGTGAITFTKQIVDAAGNPLLGADRSGFVFNVTGPGGFTATATTDSSGTATLANLATPAGGLYTASEQPRQGFMFVAAAVDGTAVGGTSWTFSLGAGQTRQVLVQNRQGAATGTVTITKTIVDANGSPASGSRAGFTITITCGTSFNQSATTDINGNAQINNVPAGNCQINEVAASGFTLFSIIPQGVTSDIGNNGTITVVAGQTLNVAVRNTASQAPTETIQLFAGCNNQSLTWPVGTPISSVASGVSPFGALQAIWRYDAAQARFFGFSPNPNAPSDYTVVIARLEAVFICVNTAATLTRPTV
jgi:adhesin/invasin